MTQTGYSNAIVNALLGWLKGLANWVLKLFNLAGSGASPLLWLSQNWLKLLIFLLILGMAMDWLIWMIRWRPYWIWMRKKRIIVNDERFLTEKDFEDAELAEEGDPIDRRYVVPSTVVKRREARPLKAGAPRKPAPMRPATRRRLNNTVVPRREHRPEQTSEFPVDELFEVGRDQPDFSDFYEDEVFNVSSLPERQPDRHARKRRR